MGPRSHSFLGGWQMSMTGATEQRRSRMRAHASAAALAHHWGYQRQTTAGRTVSGLPPMEPEGETQVASEDACVFIGAWLAHVVNVHAHATAYLRLGPVPSNLFPV